MSKNLVNFSDLAKKDIFDLIELANNFKSEDSLDYRNENLFPDKKIASMSVSYTHLTLPTKA